MIRLPDFTQPEIDNIRELANFTRREDELFTLRAKGYTHDECREIMHISESTRKRTNKSMLAKIIRIL